MLLELLHIDTTTVLRKSSRKEYYSNKIDNGSVITLLYIQYIFPNINCIRIHIHNKSTFNSEL